MVVHHAKIILRFSKSLLGGFTGPRERFRVIFRHGTAFQVHHAKIVLRLSVSFIGCFAVPRGSLPIRLWYAVALLTKTGIVKVPKTGLCRIDSLLGGLTNPRDALCVVLSNAETL